MLRVLVFPTLAREEILTRLAALPGVDARSVQAHGNGPDELNQATALVLPAPLWNASLAEQVSRHAPQLRLVQLVSAGYEELLLHGVPVTAAVANAGDCWAGPVAEHGLALMLALARHVPQLVQRTRERIWDRSVIEGMCGLQGASLLLLGYGNIGREVASRADAFGMKVTALTRNPERHPATPLATVAPLSAVQTHAGNADFILACLPASAATRGLLNASFFEGCKKGAIFINVGRGDVTDTKALVDALRTGRLGGAGLDVTDPEPLPPDHPLWETPNVLISPHAAIGGQHAALHSLADMVTENMRRLMLSQQLRNRIFLHRQHRQSPTTEQT